MSMPAPDSQPLRLRAHSPYSLSAKLVLLLLSSMVMVFALLGYLNVRLHRRHLEQATLLSAERVSDIIRHSTTEYMLRNDQPGLHRAIQAMAAEPGVEKIRIFDQEGRISYSTDSAELNHVVDKRGEACYACHTQSQPLAHLNRPDRFRIYHNSGGVRTLGIITPIENQPGCWNAACHAHPPEQRILGVLDTNLSLTRTDLQLAESTRDMVLYTACALLMISVLTWFFIWRVVGLPVKALEHGTDRLAAGDLGFQIEVRSKDEIGDLANSFNSMSRQLEAEHSQNLVWTRTLEDRVERKTAELKRAHEHALHTEKMASIGRMAAVLAHEINNPLSGILTYAKLLKKWLGRDWAELHSDAGAAGSHRRQEICDSLDLIASESRRCGDLVKNLLTFSRTSPMNIQPTDLNAVAGRVLRLVQHQTDLAGIQVEPQLDPSLPQILCDAAQMEQVVLVLVMNAIDSMPQGGTVWLTTAFDREKRLVRVTVRDEGTGIPADLLPRLFEPFLTTKESGHGVGLGLAISKSIMERHGGDISASSEPGSGATFTVTLPCETTAPQTQVPIAPQMEPVAASPGQR